MFIFFHIIVETLGSAGVYVITKGFGLSCCSVSCSEVVV